MPRLCLVACLLSPLVAVSPSWSVSALHHDARLCSAELLVMRGDLVQLQDAGTDDERRGVLQDRLAAALGTLAWLCRRYAEAHGEPTAPVVRWVHGLRERFESRDWAEFANGLDRLIERLPFSPGALHPARADSTDVETGARLYRSYCAGCHDQPDQAHPFAADVLFTMARRQPLDEFLARMLLGVHGTPAISLRNPLSDRDIAGLTAYLRGGAPGVD